MKVDFPVVLDGRTINISQEVDTQRDLFKFLADMQELFGGVEKCTRNGKVSQNVKLRVRAVDDDLYYEAVCYDGDAECKYAKKSFGCHKGKDGTLFPHSKDKEGNWLPNNGWMKWNKDTQKEE